ncbi:MULTISPECIES: TetR/AcrR family transcriptional regulator [Acinetobacter]|uniref:TetR/AcrR family transcriptional regulator n=1 Tax=Acinetobacter TaxID=469 RepID=UPI000C592857|nr:MULTISPECIES: TetR/AcrR family transcriptional regulator [unclassified Acinetobacter]MBC68765.1 TetR family transcriptional regulator [Acinetobacter sp.]MBT51238.1 TetR family transcriptional regulator [Acinetobacter sp.]|tara:strand:+ start:433 stop:981 length:549 start_codon:yes stop_codon:yes gene_type:complete
MVKRQQLAAHNRDELLNAAEEVFRVQGVHVPLQVIIDHAGVGRATFYRNFADRKALIAALLERAITRLEQRAQALMPYDDGFIRLIESNLEQLPQLVVLIDYWRIIDRQDPIMLNIYERRDKALQPLIDQAIQHHLCRPDLTTQDFAMITAILGSSFQGHTAADQVRLARRAIELLLNGIKI